MEKIFITIVGLYALFVAICLVRLNLSKRRKKDIIGKGNGIPETDINKTDIVGKSKFVGTHSTALASKSLPLTATAPENENQIEKSDTFAPSNEVKQSARVPLDKLDDVFSDTPPEDELEVMDIDYPLEYEDDNEEVGEEEETEEVEGSSQAMLASGVKFEALGNAVRTINQSNEATEEQKISAGSTLLEIRQTDMFEQLVSSKPDAKETITQLMNARLTAFYKQKEKEAGNTVNSRKAPDNFDMRDFI